MRTKPTLLAVLAAVFLTGGGALAQESADEGTESAPPTLDERRARREAMRERWQNMTEEDREAFRAKMREKGGPGNKAMRRRFEHMSEEERAAMRERWQNMSDEERAAMREKMRERRAGKHGPGAKGMEGPEA